MTRNTPVAADIMTTRVITLTPDQDLFEAIGLLTQHQISGAPVVDRAGRYLGVFTERTSIQLLLNAVVHHTPTNTIEKWVDSEALTVSPDTDLLTIAQMLKESSYRRLPVLKNNKVVGLISRRDVLRAAHKLMELDQPERETTFLYLSLIRERSAAPV
ncbi:MAG: CBS domain-containing protein [Planctomycetaceae bacterium]|nr:CBS domain-containing protein [Planctomycetaceae bacterium]MCA9032093.1 CBS domain-containing protein [Planctomycetaceae bacterium]MCB9949602.1 CBS domain-containing protein [Planctomycetaceae bacterium]